MIRPDAQVIKAFALMVRQYPDVLTYLQAWRTHELENLPFALANSAISQGRCQVLGELVKFAQEAPDLAAKKPTS
mgnify:CR=1 FL=1|jgi:hypothetical protein